VHFVTPEVDHGPIIVQAAVPVRPDDTEATLAARVLEQEHRILPQAIRWFAEERLAISESGVVNLIGQTLSQRQLISPWDDKT
jgi:phosphoribosylglycinamide formyltransferase-1